MQDFATSPGFETSLRFKYSNQTDLRSGTGSVDLATLALPNDR